MSGAFINREYFTMGVHYEQQVSHIGYDLFSGHCHGKLWKFVTPDTISNEY